ncbi:MAG: hypothetical protein AVO33_04725 [delta proteobacterium ML8_F1]|nr:MAG: hypothetical protein AVO33_04725 [delta proteobacterium ML8_F1]
MKLVKKEQTNGDKVVWRNSEGEITCPGDSCPQACDESCPIHLNTLAALSLQLGETDETIALFKRIIEMAPDYYDAWNNMAAVCGGQGHYEEALDYYAKAHELAPDRSAPILGLALANKDLKAYQESLRWCDLYDTIEGDHKLDTTRAYVTARLRKKTARYVAEPLPGDLILKTSDGKYSFRKITTRYFFYEGNLPLLTPGGQQVTTYYQSLAERIIRDLERFGYDFRPVESILEWHFTMIDSFSKMTNERVESILHDSYLVIPDWTTTMNHTDEEWFNVFDSWDNRKESIMEWLGKCTRMQKTAVSFIGNAYHSLNIAYVLAVSLEEKSSDKRMEFFEKLAKMVAEHSSYGTAHEVLDVFKTYEIYYSLHLEEYGPVVNLPIQENHSDEALEDVSDLVGKKVSIESLLGRNFFFYSDHGLDDTQGKVAAVNDLELDESDDEEDDFDDEEELFYREPLDSGLSNHLPESYWLKRYVDPVDARYYYLLYLSLDENGVIDWADMVVEFKESSGFGIINLPGGSSAGGESYDPSDNLNHLSNEIKEDLLKLICGRSMPLDFSFIGKRLPQAMIDERSGERGLMNEKINAQSAFRCAYMILAINVDEQDRITEFEYTTYHSSGDSWFDMFSRPIKISNHRDEGMDMLLRILDRYSEEEFRQIIGS